MPQWSVARSRQLSPEQQPDGHELASHTQSPTTQCWPAMHAGPSPHAHVPSSAHTSARIGSHVLHTPPAAPHAMGDGCRQLAPEQHPPGQVALLQPLQTPASHVSPAAHTSHARPALPHAITSVPGRHVSPSQQPLAHDVASQTHAPASQRCPAPHAGPVPQPCMQRELVVPTDVHDQPSSTVHVGEHPSLGSVFPSSHASTRSTITPSPQIAGAPRCTATTAMWPFTIGTLAAPDATTVPADRPSTRAVKIAASALSGKSTTTLSPVGERGRAGSGRMMGSNAVVEALPAVSVPPKRS